MKNYRFYAEMPEARRSKSGSKAWRPFTVATLRDPEQRYNCIAVPLDDNGRPLWLHGVPQMECVGAVFDMLNSAVTTTAADRDYLRKRCVRVPEALARKLHPALFAYLDD